MKPFYAAIIALVLTAQGACAQTELPEAFTDGLKRAKMTFEMPEGFTPTAIVDNPHMNYEYAIKCDTAEFEVRYAIRPLDKLMKSYENSLTDSTRVMINPDQVNFYIGITTATGYNISKSTPDSRTFDKERAKTIFNADNMMASFTEPRYEFSKDYKYCLMFSIYKKSLGTAFYFFMGNDQRDIVKMVAKVSGSLKFEEIKEE